MADEKTAPKGLRGSQSVERLGSGPILRRRQRQVPRATHPHAPEKRWASVASPVARSHLARVRRGSAVSSTQRPVTLRPLGRGGGGGGRGAREAGSANLAPPPPAEEYAV